MQPSVSVPAYVNLGRWVADCPTPWCGYAYAMLFAGQPWFECDAPQGCRAVVPLVWPPNAVEIWQELLRRPRCLTRNWAPAGHRQAIACGVPDGQTVADLRTEFAAIDPVSFAVSELVAQGATAVYGAPAAAAALAAHVERQALEGGS